MILIERHAYPQAEQAVGALRKGFRIATVFEPRLGTPRIARAHITDVVVVQRDAPVHTQRSCRVWCKTQVIAIEVILRRSTRRRATVARMLVGGVEENIEVRREGFLYRGFNARRGGAPRIHRDVLRVLVHLALEIGVFVVVRRNVIGEFTLIHRAFDAGLIVHECFGRQDGLCVTEDRRRINVEGEIFRPAATRHAEVSVGVFVDVIAADQTTNHGVAGGGIGQQSIGRRKDVVRRGNAIEAERADTKKLAQLRKARANDGRARARSVEYLVTGPNLLVRGAQTSGDIELVGDSESAIGKELERAGAAAVGIAFALIRIKRRTQ